MNLYSIHILVTSILMIFLKMSKEIKVKVTERGCLLGPVCSKHVNDITSITNLRQAEKLRIMIMLIVMKAV
jgi:hypothetical protein